MYDGAIVFNTKIDDSNVAKDLERTKRKIEKSTEDIQKAKAAKMPLVEQAKELGDQLVAAKAKLHKLKGEMATIDAAMEPGTSPEAFIEAGIRKPEVAADIAASEKEVASLQKQWDAVNDKVDDYDSKIRQAQNDIDHNTQKAAELAAQMNSTGAKAQEAFDKARASADKFGKRLLKISASMLVFRVFSSIMSGVRQHMGKMLQTNAEYTAQLAKLKGALMTAFQPIYEFVLPGLLAVLRVLTAIVSVAARVLSALFGTSASQSAKNAEELNKEAEAIGGVGDAAKKAKKELAGFDEINTLGTPSVDSGGGGGGGGGHTADFSDFNTAEYMAKIDELTLYLSGALLALGAILAFSGANVPLGIGLMAAGAAGLAAVIKENWDAISGKLGDSIQTIMVLAGAAALAIGMILAFSGVKVGLGLALVAVGAASMIAAAMINWNGMPSELSSPLAQIVMIASGVLLALGLVLAFSGVNLPLGLALIAAGAVGLVTVAAVNWNAIQEKLQTVWASIKQWFNTHVKPKLTLEYWKEKFSTIADGLVQKIRDGINAAIALMNKFINWVNEKFKISWSGLTIDGVKIIDSGSWQLINIPNIPMLAQGAVIPANKPFLAMVGDQKNGTNVEAPLETIKQALAEVMNMRGGDGDVVIRFEGDLAQLGRVLKPVIDRENKRVGPSLAGGNAG